MKKQLLFLITLSISILGFSQTFNSPDSNGNILKYNIISATTVSVIPGSTIANINVDIPATVSNGGTSYSVVSIGNNAFSSTAISSVNIPSTVISIGQLAFANTNLTSIVLPSNLETIGNYAFQDNQLIGLTIPSNVTSIGTGAFRNNNSLTSITTLATVPPVITTANNSNDTFYDGITGDRSDIDLIIPAGTTGVYVTDSGALWTGFNSVTENLNTGDTYIYDYITYEVISVASSTVKAVYYNTAGGTIVNIPATIPNGQITYSVVEIGNNAFQNKGLTAVTLPNTLINIGVNAFFINNLSSVTIPNSVVTINDIAFAQNQSMTNLVLGNSVTNIGEAAFRFTALTTITIPASVTNIGIVAFGGLGDIITDVYCEGIVPPTISTSNTPNSDTFNLSRSSIHLHIPAGTMGAYVTDAGALWTGFNPITEDALSANDYGLANDIKIITTTDGIEIVTSNSARLENYSLYSISGAKVASGQVNQIATTRFASGIYILKLDFDRGTVVKKIIIN